MSDYRRFAKLVYERDQWKCRLCGRPVARQRIAPHPLSPSLDHVVPRAAGGDDEPGNLQTAHLRCNESKHTRPARGSGLTVRLKVDLPPELLGLIRHPASEDESASEPLPHLDPNTIGDVFDAAVDLARRAQMKDVPNAEMLHTWAASEQFLCVTEARNAIYQQIWACYDEQGHQEQLRRWLMAEQPCAWFIADFLEQEDVPQSMKDDSGWDCVAAALLRYVGLAQVEELVERATAGLPLETDPLRALEASDDVQVVEEPGFYRGHPLSAYADSIRALKAAGRLEECEQLLLRLIASLEAKVGATGFSLSPELYEQLAIVRRQRGDVAGEVEILERYFHQPGALGSRPLEKRLVKAREKLDSGPR